MHKTVVVHDQDEVLLIHGKYAPYSLGLIKHALTKLNIRVHTVTTLAKTIVFKRYKKIILLDAPLVPISHPHVFIIATQPQYMQKEYEESAQKLYKSPTIMFVPDTVLIKKLDTVVENLINPEDKKIDLRDTQRSTRFLPFSKRPLTFKRLLPWAFLGVVVIHVLFTPFLLASLALVYPLGEKRGNSPLFTSLAQGSLTISKLLYTPVRPSYLVVAAPVALALDNTFALTQTSIELGRSLHAMSQKAQPLIGHYNGTTPLPDTDALFRLQEVIKDTQQISSTLDKLTKHTEGVPFIPKDLKNRLYEINTLVQKLEPFLPHLPTILGFEREQKYLVLFANNMELRPGGGFIGSFAIITIDKAHVRSFTVYDVYDADGQLKARIPPPFPISEHLNQPFFYLRDSAFNEDFPTNVKQAEFFLKEEMQEEGFTGVALITTTGIQKILKAFPEGIIVPGYKERITASNFYIKAQLYAEENFFPGSTKKKSFLEAVGLSLMDSLYKSDPILIAQALMEGLQEKQIVMVLEDPQVQKLLDASFFSGRVLEPQCVVAAIPCTNSYVMPVEANLGVNKANAFVKRSINHTISFTPNGSALHTVTVKFTNASKPNAPLGGPYKNYFQLLISPLASVREVKEDGRPAINHITKEPLKQRIAILNTTPPASAKEVTITYEEPLTMHENKLIYQLMVQKQIGLTDTDYLLTFTLPPGMSVVNTNFMSIVKGTSVIYNSKLTTDKLFVIELEKTNP